MTTNISGSAKYGDCEAKKWSLLYCA